MTWCATRTSWWWRGSPGRSARPMRGSRTASRQAPERGRDGPIHHPCLPSPPRSDRGDQVSLRYTTDPAEAVDEHVHEFLAGHDIQTVTWDTGPLYQRVPG